MSRKRKLLALAAVLALVVFPEYAALALMTIAAPVFAWLLASIALFAFVITASITVPIGRALMDRSEAVPVRRTAEIIYLKDRVENKRRAA